MNEKRKQFSNKTVNIFLIVFFSLVGLMMGIMYSFVEKASSQDITRGIMMVIEFRRIPPFLREHKRLPDNLSELPPTATDDNDIKDGWGRDILYSKEPDGTVKLLSLGKDGKPGGKGEDADIKVTFKIGGIFLLRLGIIAGQIEEYVTKYHRLPERLSDLPKIERQENSFLDIWGREIQYTPNTDGTFTLSSLGKDGKPGGEGDDADTIIKFKVIKTKNKDRPFEVVEVTGTLMPKMEKDLGLKMGK